MEILLELHHSQHYGKPIRQLAATEVRGFEERYVTVAWQVLV